MVSITGSSNRFEEQCKATNKDSNLALEDFLQGENEISTFWEFTKTNLKAGKIRMLIIADSIPKELQRIIEFLNEQMTPAEILGLEIKQFVGQGNIKTLVPRVIGQTVSADITKGVNKSGDSHWTEETFFAELLNQRGQQEAEAARKIFDWIKPKVTYFYYGVGKRGSFAPILKTKDISRFCFAIWTDGLIEIYFQHMKGRLPFDKEEKRKELLNMLNSIKGVSIPEDRLSARPSFPISLLTDKFEMKKFIDAFNWYWNEQQL